MTAVATVTTGPAPTPPAGPGRQSRRRQRWSRRLPILPAVLYTIVVTQIPFVLTIWYSLQSWNLLTPANKHFIGLGNYRLIFTNASFRQALLTTVEMTALTVVIAMLLGLAFALLLDRRFLGRSVVRTLLITPFLVMPTAAALLWKTTMLDPTYGLFNWLLSPFGVHHVAFLSVHPFASVVAIGVWQWTPFMTLIVLAGLQGQPGETIEAAHVDGAGGWAVFRELTLPHLRPYLELGILLGSIYIVNSFDAVYNMTQGGPGTATTNVPYFLYQQAFQAFNIGQASALGIVTVILTLIVASFALRLLSSVFRLEPARA